MNNQTKQSMKEAIQLLFLKVAKSLAHLSDRSQNSQTFKGLRWFAWFVFFRLSRPWKMTPPPSTLTLTLNLGTSNWQWRGRGWAQIFCSSQQNRRVREMRNGKQQSNSFSFQSSFSWDSFPGKLLDSRAMPQPPLDTWCATYMVCIWHHPSPTPNSTPLTQCECCLIRCVMEEYIHKCATLVQIKSCTSQPVHVELPHCRVCTQVPC